MKLSILFSLLPLAFHSYASPVQLAANFTLGPAVMEDLKPQVEEFMANRAEIGKLHSRASGSSCGVYFCEDGNFKGRCYWGCYPQATFIYPDTYWVFRITSVGPDPGVGLTANYGNCKPSTQPDPDRQTFAYPGGNLNSHLNDHLGCFWIVGI